MNSSIKRWNMKALATIISMSLSMATIAEDSEDENKESGNEVITVTAQKRAQSIQDVGIAVTALYGETLREQGISEATEISKLIPNVEVRNIGGGGLPVVIIRGIGLQNFRINDSPTSSFYIDEVYQTSIASAEFSMYDLERLEVLKGPQGGLYGRNTIGGAIQIISAKPDIDAGQSGFIDLGIGSFSARETEFGINVPVSDKAAARISGRIDSNGDKDYYSVSDNQKHGEADRWGLRTQLLFQPSDDVELLFKVHGGSMEVETPLLQTVGLYANWGNGSDYGLPNVSLGLISGLFGAGSGGLCQSILDGNGSDPATCATLTGITPDAYGVTASEYASVSTGPVPLLDSQWSGASLIADIKMDGMTLTSITAYDSIDYKRSINADATPIVFQDIDYSSDISFWSQEFRLFSAPSDRYNWIVGASYSEDELIESTELFGGEGLLPFAFAALGYPTKSKQDYIQKSDGFSIYGHSDYALTETVNLITELRYTKENKSFSGGATLGFSDGSTAPFLDIANSPAGDSTSFSAVSGKVGLTWNLNEDVMFYGNLSRGFKTGGFFGGFATNISHLTPYDEETINAFEVGFKSDVLDNTLRMNGSIFKYYRKDVQQNAADPNATVAIARLTNIGDVETTGAELDFVWSATDNLKINFSLGYTDAFISDSDYVVSSGINLLGTASLEGLNVPNYSKLSSNLQIRYEHELGDSYVGTAQLEHSYHSEQDLSLITNPQIEDAIYKEPGFGLANFRYILDKSDSNWRLIISVNNLTDKIYRTEARSDGLYGFRQIYAMGRTWAVNYSYNW